MYDITLISQLRGKLTDIQRSLLNELWNHYLAEDDWPASPPSKIEDRPRKGTLRKAVESRLLDELDRETEVYYEERQNLGAGGSLIDLTIKVQQPDMLIAATAWRGRIDSF